MMRISRFCLLTFYTTAMVLIVGCTKSDQEQTPAIPVSTYSIFGIKYDYQNMTKVDSIYHSLDTITYYNTTNTTQPLQTFAPYASLADSLKIEIDSSTPVLSDMFIERGMYLPAIIQEGEVFYASQDSVYVKSLKDIKITRPLSRKERTTVGFVPTPRTWYQITADFYRVHYQIPFTITLKEINSGETKEFSGSITGAYVATTTNDPDNYPLTGIYESANNLD